MNKIYVVKVFNEEHEDGKYIFDEETAMITANRLLALNTIYYNIGGIDDCYYKYALLITIEDGKVYGEIDPLDLQVFKYNKHLNIYEKFDEDKDMIKAIEERYCYYK